MAQYHAVPGHSIPPDAITAIGIWSGGAGSGGGTIRMIYNKSLGGRHPVDFVRPVPGSASTGVSLGLDVSVIVPLPDSHSIPLIRCLSCSARIASYWLECPRCHCNFVFAGQVPFPGAAALSRVALPATAKENPRFARILAYSGRRSGVRSKISELVKQANRLWAHLVDYQSSFARRQELQAKEHV